MTTAKEMPGHVNAAYRDAAENIIFLKRQQWLATNYVLLLYAAIFVISAYYFSRTDVARNWLGVLTIGAFVIHWWILHLLDPLAQALQILGHDVFRDDSALGSNDRRESYDVVAATGTDIRDSHPGFDPEQAHELARFVGIVALLFVVPDRADNVRHRAIGFRKGDRRHARLRDEVLRSA